MGRATKQNNLTTPELIAQINPENAALARDFLDYLKSTKKADTTILTYKNDLEIAFVWGLQNNSNKPFVNWAKRDIVRFQNWLINDNGNGSARVRRIKATLSSMSNYIENILDDEYPNFRNIINKIENPVAQPVREKTVITEEQLEHLLDVLVERQEYEKACMVALAAYSGRRKSELVLFKASYFGDENIVYGSLYKTPEKIKTKGRGGGKFIYCYTLANKFKPYFDLWMKEREEKNIQSEWLFPLAGDCSQHLQATTLNSWAESFSKILNISCYFHMFRHSYTTYLARCGIPDSVIASIVSWESTDMVAIYNDTTIDENLAKYFDENGIKQSEAKSIADL